MNNNPKKSKAFIITFIVVLILLVGAYYLFKNSESIFGTKSSLGTNKSFSPLLGTESPKDLDTINKNNGGTNTGSGGQGGGTSGGATSDTGSNIDNSGMVSDGLGIGDGLALGNGSGANNGGFVMPPFNPLPTPAGTGPLPPTPSPTPTVNPNICPADDPLVFTDAEKTELESLLRDYYMIATTLKTDDDLALLNIDITTNQALIDQADLLATACLVQKTDPSYTGPQAIRDNPYYTDPNTSTSSYVSAFSLLEQVFDIW